MNRGARRETIFPDADSQQLFLSIVAQLPKRFGVRVHAYALMPNHYHLMLSSERGQLSRAMRHLGGEYTRQLNQRYRWDGPLFRGRFHNRLVSTDDYWRHLLVYLHLNPVRAGLPDTGTSHGAYTGTEPRPDWLDTAELQESFGSVQAYADSYSSTMGGNEPPTERFDAERLWAPNSTGTVDVPVHNAPVRSVDQAMKKICAVTGLTVEEVIACPKGRKSNPACWLAAWYMSRGCGIDHGQIAMMLATSQSGVSKRVRYVEERMESSPQLAAWVMALGQKRPKVESGNT
ncbi:MAG: hypothetical protein GWP91_23335 [Rhodobacterales bacterium]|nr:hypothetical protein [Rhodobacterales bacterium]